MLDVSPMQKSGQKNTTISTTFYLNPPNKLVVNSDNTHPLNKHSSDICVLENKEFEERQLSYKAKLKDYKERLKEHKEFISGLEKEGLNGESETVCSQRDEKKNKLLDLRTFQLSLSSLRERLLTSKSSKELLESRLINIQKIRKNYFKNSFMERHSKKEHPSSLKKVFKEITHSNLRHTKNSKKIEKSLLRFYETILVDKEVLDPVEEFILKKNKTQEDGFTIASTKIYGYQHSDFHKIKKYRPDPFSLPLLSEFFDESNLKLLPTPPPPSLPLDNRQRSIRSFLKPTNRIQTTVHQNDPDYQILFLKGHIPVRTINGKQEAYRNRDEIPSKDYEKEIALQKLKKLKPEEIEKVAKQVFRRAWQTVVNNILGVHRFCQKEKMEREQNARRFSQMCCKEVRKKYMKSQRMHREFQLRAKRMQKEMLVFWRKRERELNEIKKRKERLETELKRREEEEREAMLQKKRLEFLMKQSDIYAHFMARKLGIAIDIPNDPTGLMGNGTALPPGSIDENAALENVQMMINEQREMMLAFGDKGQDGSNHIGILPPEEYTTLEDLKNAQNLDFSYVPQDTFSVIINTPKSFLGELKEYQLKGLRWLDNLYDQGINGILADEMGLGKTIQAIALLAHISENKKNYGPFLIVAPSSTLYNWQQEIKRFCPVLKVLPYWGNLKQRKTIRKFLSLKSLGSPHSPFHIVITSYQLIVADQKTFQRMKWQYVILDEAQAIKNINSQRWKTLLSFTSRNKLLLTGTPIQNTMAELWALLHFIMPKLFDSHDQFQEWFSKDIEAHSQDQKAVNQHQLSRLHAILKPFMLRRVKKDVEHEIGQKHEFEILCEMTKRQQELYDMIKQRLSIKDFFQMLESKAKVESLMNLVMQFRKVCNHPELFERRPCRSPFFFHSFYYYTGNIPLLFGQLREITFKNANAISFELPKLLFDEVIEPFSVRKQFLLKHMLFFNNLNVFNFSNERENHDFNDHFSNSKKDVLASHKKVETNGHVNFSTGSNGKSSNLNIFNGMHGFSFLRLLGFNQGLLETLWNTDEFYFVFLITHFFITLERIGEVYEEMPNKYRLWINKNIFKGRDNYYSLSSARVGIQEVKNLQQIKDTFLKFNHRKLLFYSPAAIAPAIKPHCSSSSFTYFCSSLFTNRLGKALLLGENFSLPPTTGEKSLRKINRSVTYLKYPYDFLINLDNSDTPDKTGIDNNRSNGNLYLVNNANISNNGSNNFVNVNGGSKNFSSINIFKTNFCENPSMIEIPDFINLVADSAKLNYLDKKLEKLKEEGHRVLIFCQMTKMMDILEDYLMRKKYQFFRLDGSCNIADRRDMVKEFQTNPLIFAFLLSTRAGGLGVTLTAADTVIFYDNDWNPTMDAQATDRAHRIGQVKEVNVFRLVTKGTIEERILKRAQQKQTVQATVYSGGAFKADIFKPQEVMELLFDEAEIEVNETNKFMNRGGKRMKGKKKEKIQAEKGKRRFGRKKVEKENKVGLKVETKGDGGKDEMDIELDFSPLMMNNNEQDEKSSEANFE